MNTLRSKVLRLRKEINMSWESWAEQSCRSVETLKKQLSEDSNPTLSTMMVIAAPLHATVEIMTSEEKETLSKSKMLNEKVKELEAIIDEYRHGIEVRDIQIEYMRKNNDHLQDLVDRLRSGLTSKEEKVAHKDDIIEELLRKFDVI